LPPRSPLPALASLAGQAEPAKQELEFAPRKAYRECLNRSFAFLLIRGAVGPGKIAETIVLSGAQFEFTFTPQLPNGSFGTPVRFGFDCVANKQI
jgi:hypothetical protein